MTFTSVGKWEVINGQVLSSQRDIVLRRERYIENPNQINSIVRNEDISPAGLIDPDHITPHEYLVVSCALYLRGSSPAQRIANVRVFGISRINLLSLFTHQTHINSTDYTIFKFTI